ncbi:hypothetical protein B0A58_08795 [Flavobacterium branchiophilum NBRC 15030 = ATCC 35035]|uniref:Uncharacterized protein n=1 Tax=Flavobacterium branchiophilum TaxID=55197 RepID=A0A543G290_9FLAO|nr:hypothetical protein [Flavobacterium branchiophilum]OXA75465.1 hypothetical protein B0A58_08795 [Flavobacterium branchiophilum NBRC 15030 = ATCC 35035]TQM40216.1 hypothetical protein BC670_1091 [Flavobacterium branchiophilum]GEM55837.1 hypothetical protein FB1_20580 [Flavobacterium branchiophilum NBRC 15030 = ATCC 35035]
MSNITTIGALEAQKSSTERLNLGNKLLSGGEDISRYNMGVCHDVVAYTIYMLRPSISPSNLVVLKGQEWLTRFNYLEQGKEWNGDPFLERGKAIGFYRLVDKTFFHSAISTGFGTEIRSVNGLTLGASWLFPSNLSSLGTRSADGTYRHDGTNIKVYISSL